VAGFNKVWTYAMHEIFHVKNNRSFVGGHFSKASPNFFLVPLRLFLGFSWLFEGIEKLQDIIKDPGNVFLIPQSVAASSGASEVADYGEALGVPAFIEKMVDFGMELMFYKPDGSFTALAPIFQGLMVVGEIVVGLLLIAGLFTALASIISIAMSAMIWASGMAAPEMLWYIFGSIALIGGSGSALGLDYYVLPFLKKRWKKIKIVKKWYIYTE
jgi:NADH dehydrogenase